MGVAAVPAFTRALQHKRYSVWANATRAHCLITGGTSEVRKPGTFPHGKAQDGLAILAVQAGSKDDAMRLWQRRVRQDLTDHRGLSELASHGLRERLAAYYAGLAQRAPGNYAIAGALKELAGSEKRE